MLRSPAIGIRGPQGPKGDTGTTGSQGTPGPQGARGDAGAVGATGPQGPSGAKGDAGSVGPTGAKGDVGASGAKGDQGPTGAAGSVGAAGSQGAAGAKGDAGSQGPAGFGTVTPSTPTRAIGTPFQPSTTKAVLCIYSVKTQVTNPLLAGNSSALARLLSDAATTPTTERARVEALSSVALAVTIALTTSNTALLVYLCPPGHYVLLSQAVAGTGAVSIVSQTEIALG